MPSHRGQFIRGVYAGFPIFLGYFPIAVAFGIISKTAGLGLGVTTAFSVFVFAGASQFIALSMAGLGISIGEITAAVFLINLRHLLMSASLASKLDKKTVLLPFAAFGVTDETFAVASSAAVPSGTTGEEGKITELYLCALNVTAYAGWVSGTAGFISGSLLPDKLQISLGILLYVMFVCLLVPSARKSRKAALIAILSGCINIILNQATALNPGWCIIISVIAAASFPFFSGFSGKKGCRKNPKETETVKKGETI